MPKKKEPRVHDCPRNAHDNNLREIERLEEAVKAPYTSAQIVFSIVKHGWQCDVEIIVKGRKPVKGTVCRDWGDDGPSSRKLLNKLVSMGQSGRP